MFSKMGTYEPCGIFSTAHFILIGLTIICISISLKFTYKKDKEEIHKIIKKSTILMCILETIKIIISISYNSFEAVNTYVPLYFCSIMIYAGLLSSFGKGALKRVGDICLATGSIVGGIVFIIYPSTSLPTYPVFHFFSLYSFLFHGTMVYLGLLMNITKYVEIKISDIKYFASIIGIMCILALIINNKFHGNLMFISENFPGTPIEGLYKITKGGILFNLSTILIQMTIPFLIVYSIVKIIKISTCKKK